MKVTPDDIQTIIEDPIELFYQSLRSDATKDRYTRFLHRMLCHTLEDILEGTFDIMHAKAFHKLHFLNVNKIFQNHILTHSRHILDV